jgi:hypothetical protein
MSVLLSLVSLTTQLFFSGLPKEKAPSAKQGGMRVSEDVYKVINTPVHAAEGKCDMRVC